MYSPQTKHSRLLQLISLACLLLSACGPASEDLAATMAVETVAAKIAAFSPTPTVTATATETLTPTATITPTPTETATPLPPTATFTPEPIAALAGEEAVIAYSGPGKVYNKLAELQPGEELYFIGRSNDAEWLAFTLPDTQEAWVSVADLEDLNFNVYQLEAFDPPPTPIWTHKLVVVNDTPLDLFVSIPDAGIQYVNFISGQSLVFTLPVQDYTVFISRNQTPGGYTAYVALDRDLTVIASPTEHTSVYITIQ
ncbi:MAG: SH3 domain-containing protein [Anaerolineales bacterium]|nr:SH3 domain-containing protein [Anaerolineales bacterium]